MTSQDRDGIGETNQAAFNSLMSDLSKPEQTWLITYVTKLGIPMKSRDWLQAALAARLVLELGKTARDASSTFANISGSLDVGQRRMDQSLTAVQHLVSAEEQRRKTALRESVESITLAIENSVKHATAALIAPLNDPVKRIETAVLSAATAAARASATSVSAEASKNLSLRLDVFLKRIGVALVGAIALGVLIGGLGMHWYDQTHTTHTVHPARKAARR